MAMSNNLKIIKLTPSTNYTANTGDIRIICWKDTVEKCKDEPNYDSTIYIENPSILPPKIHNVSLLQVINDDCIYAAIKTAYGRTCILNMADWKRAGGLVSGGSKAQEEEIFRRSNLHKHLHQTYYPMRNLQTIYSHNVKFFKNGAEKMYETMDTHFICDILSSPALSCPELSDDYNYFKHKTDAEYMYEKIRQLFLIAIIEDVDTLILSAWGCGAFNGPVIHIAQLFKRALNEFDGYIKNVAFAILGYNYIIFKDILDGI